MSAGARGDVIQLGYQHAESLICFVVLVVVCCLRLVSVRRETKKTTADVSCCDLSVLSDGFTLVFCSDPRRARLDPAVINCLLRIRLHLLVTDMPELSHVDVAGNKCDKQSGAATLLVYWRPFRAKNNHNNLVAVISQVHPHLPQS